MSSSGFLHDRFGVVLDACVLYPPTLRDTLLRAAEGGLYRVHWSDEILDELRRNIIAKGNVSEVDAQDLIDEMRGYFKEATVTGYEPLLSAMANDEKDRHVLAAAVRAGAEVIVTDNNRHFPAHALDPFNVEAQTADVFLTHLFHLYPGVMERIVQQQAADYRSPPRTVEDVLGRLTKIAPLFAELVRQRLG